jgi:predicted phage terminase large subunit-like protein
MSFNEDQITDSELIELENLLAEERAKELKDSLFEFVKEFWSTIVTGDYVHNWHIEYLCDEVQLVLDKYVLDIDVPHIPNDKWYEGITEEIKQNVIINISPGTTKSTIISRMATAWLWAKNASKTIIGNTIDSKNATEFSTSTKDLLQSELFKKYFPDVTIRRDVSAKTFYQSNKGGKRYSLTTRGSKTGKHGDVLIDDDPMDYETANSPADAKRCIEGFKALQTRKKDKAKVPYILVMQRLSSKDTTAHALKVFGENVRHICLPAENTFKNVQPSGLNDFYIDGLLDPNRLNREILEGQKKGLLDDAKPISDIAFNIQFNQLSVSEDGLLYPKLNKVKHLPTNREGVIRYSFTDVADTGSDYFATWFLEVNQGKLYVFDAIYTQQGSGITSQLLKTKIEHHASVMNKIETNNQGSVFITLLRQLGVNVSGYTNTGNKEERINAYAQFISFINFVEPNENSSPDYIQAIKHLEAYPKQGKSEDGHDDAEDALTEAIRYLYTNARYLFMEQAA